MLKTSTDIWRKHLHLRLRRRQPSVPPTPAPQRSSTYSYNGFGLRIAETDGATHHDLASDGAAPGSPLIVDHNLTTRTLAEYFTPGVNEHNVATSTLSYYGFDAVGSNRALVNTGQGLAATWSYYAYGLCARTRGCRRSSGSWGRGTTRPTPTG